ncbi:hypothetical protein K438DRAFT_1782918 [Mycena galopus ATCC 62051]|nr:hypothetical protein K438DRAFT_1782918 [Mycena galopus ATCC 62051]
MRTEIEIVWPPSLPKVELDSRRRDVGSYRAAVPGDERDHARNRMASLTLDSQRSNLTHADVGPYRAAVRRCTETNEIPHKAKGCLPAGGAEKGQLLTSISITWCVSRPESPSWLGTSGEEEVVESPFDSHSIRTATALPRAININLLDIFAGFAVAVGASEAEANPAFRSNSKILICAWHLALGSESRAESLGRTGRGVGNAVPGCRSKNRTAGLRARAEGRCLTERRRPYILIRFEVPGNGERNDNGFHMQITEVHTNVTDGDKTSHKTFGTQVRHDVHWIETHAPAVDYRYQVAAWDERTAKLGSWN